MIERWPAAQLGRMMPYDERMYEWWADRADTPLPEATARLLGLCLVRDGEDMGRPLLDRLIRLVTDSGMLPAAQPMLAVLALRVPALLERHPDLGRHFASPDQALFAYQVALQSPDRPEVAEMIAELGTSVAANRDRVNDAVAVPSMVAGLLELPVLLPTVLSQLAVYGELAWSQVRPSELAAAVSAAGDPSLVHQAVASYVGCRGGEEFEGADAAAMEWLRGL
ncbi:hypothetical protein ACFFX1_07800 [Dactylosporangium sucinum]|nr:hypothetical protein [Dactylosporangium sucinum]